MSQLTMLCEKVFRSPRHKGGNTVDVIAEEKDFFDRNYCQLAKVRHLTKL